MKITLRDFRGREKWEMIISISWVMNLPLIMCHVGYETIYIDFMGHENTKKAVPWIESHPEIHKNTVWH